MRVVIRPSPPAVGNIGKLMTFEDSATLFKTTTGGIKVEVSDLEIKNIFTLGRPFSILQTTPGRSNWLNNSITIGTQNRPLEVKAKVMGSVSATGMWYSEM